jgi:hypothetical protein
VLSSENVDIKITGPSSISSGDNVNLVLSILNENKAPLESVILTIEYPSGAKSISGDEELKTKTEDLGGVLNGNLVSRDINFLLFGNKDTLKFLNIKIQYRMRGSNAVLVKEKKYEILLESSPVILNIDYPKEVNSNQNINFDIDVTSNSANLLKGLYLKIDYPYGFSYQNSNLDPVLNKNEWFLGDIKNGEKRKFNIKGIITGQNEEERTFRFILGTKSDELGDIDTVLSEEINTVVIKRAFLDLTLNFSGLLDKGDYFVLSGSNFISSKVSFLNTLSDKISNIKAEISFNSPYIDKSSVNTASGGFYNSLLGQIIFDKNTTPFLTELNPSESKDLFFDFRLFKLPNNIKNPEIMVKAKVSGTKISSNDDSEIVGSEVSKPIRIESTVSLNSKTLYSGDIKNTGPIPPKAEKSTTYTIEWSISNTTNDLKNVEVTTSLPPNVTYTGVIYPSTENVSYNQENKSITWKANSVSYGSGFIFSPRKVSFQVKVLPSLNQVGQTLPLTTNIKIKGLDSFTETELLSEISGVTTKVFNSNDAGQVAP